MEENAANMAREMRRKTSCMEVEMKNVKGEAYDCLAREREKVKHECLSIKMQTRVAEWSKGASRDLRMCPCIY